MAGRIATPRLSQTKSGTPKKEVAAEGKNKPQKKVLPTNSSASGSWWHYIEVGANVTRLESLLAYVLPMFFFHSPLQDVFLQNVIFQLCLFVPLVQVPAYLTSRMSYVDIGWPLGLVLLALNVAGAEQWGAWLKKIMASNFQDLVQDRAFLICGLMLFHGARMAIGALLLFFPYRFKEDLPRYQYAKFRWEKTHGMPARHWWIKIQHDTLQQCFANSVCCACPVLLIVVSHRQNPNEPLSWLEVVGFLGWLVFWLIENVADAQKALFIELVKRSGDRTAVLGHGQYRNGKFWLWTLCRHPNYFCEWACWVLMVLASVPSLYRLEGVSDWQRGGLALVLVFVVRFFHDCLMYWTGASPAEHFSVLKRGKRYEEYQATTRCFWPVEVPGIDHFKLKRWPDAKGS